VVVLPHMISRPPMMRIEQSMGKITFFQHSSAKSHPANQ
jgi:hypothetical protein